MIANDATCDAREGCITCGDIAVPLTVVSTHGVDALCADESGRTESVAVELVGPLRPGDLILVHAGVALEVLVAEKGRPA